MRIILSILFTLLTIWAFGQCNTTTDHPKGEPYALIQKRKCKELIQNKQFETAQPIWERLYQACNACARFSDGIEIYKYLATTDTTQQIYYNQKIATLYQKMIDCKGKQTYQVHQTKGGYWAYLLGLHYATKLKDYPNAVRAFQQSIHFDKNYSHSALFKPFAQVTLLAYKIDSLSKNEVIQIREQLLSIADSISTIEIENQFLKTKTGREIFDCDFFADEIRALYDSQKCWDRNFYEISDKIQQYACSETNMIWQEVKEKYGRVLFDPSYCDFMNEIERANKNLINDRIECAIELYKAGIENYTLNKATRYKAAMQLAGLMRYHKNWKAALEYYSKAYEIDTSTGRPFIKIAMLYLMANSRCDGFERRSVINISLDYFERAANFEDTKQEAQEKIERYTQFLPSQEEIIDIKENQIIEAGCVLKKETKMRFKD